MNAKSVNAGIVKLREKCVEEEKIKDLVTTEDLLFSSSSAAVVFALGFSAPVNETSAIIKQLEELVDYEERLEHMANERIAIDLDDGVKVNYEKVQMDRNGKKYRILAPIK